MMPEKKTKIFITGIGSELMRRLVAKLDLNQVELIGLSRKPLTIPMVKMVLGDLLFPEPWEKELNGIDLVIHAAAITHSYNPKDYFNTNTEATKTLIDLCLKNKVKKFVFISSRAACMDAGSYGVSKLFAEEFLKKQNIDYLIIRPSEIFGGQKGEGIDQLINDARRKKIMACPVSLEHKLWPIYLEDAVQLMYQSIFEKEPRNKTIILNGPTAFSMVDIIKLCAKVGNNRVLILPIPKFVMYLAKFISEKLKLKIGPKPDQISRLYAKKEVQKIDFPFKSLESYLKELLSFFE